MRQIQKCQRCGKLFNRGVEHLNKDGLLCPNTGGLELPERKVRIIVESSKIPEFRIVEPSQRQLRRSYWTDKTKSDNL